MWMSWIFACLVGLIFVSFSKAKPAADIHVAGVIECPTDAVTDALVKISSCWNYTVDNMQGTEDISGSVHVTLEDNWGHITRGRPEYHRVSTGAQFGRYCRQDHLAVTYDVAGKVTATARFFIMGNVKQSKMETCSFSVRSSAPKPVTLESRVLVGNAGGDRYWKGFGRLFM
ncbi:uncharacterized protein LOC106152007 [Lingula anatina]|uniref:Uncharacterized protein LOC106152007 n=1 Tax=Lingula anatina TaxID=7574 RepID=A0A1S3H4L8_LINAN|nr:uncharacterized protein LOC106152007 [Lingula anatina]|eukprot:XP_013380912.1 uncharacterized protein LOC106152007 [Lingula anatina]